MRSAIISRRRTKRALWAKIQLGLLLILTSVGTFACSDCVNCGHTPPDFGIRPQTSEDNLLGNLQVAYRLKRIDEYQQLLSDDFRFYFDPATRQTLGLEYWTRTQDSLATSRLFSAPEVTRIVIDLTWPVRTAAHAGFVPPRDDWTRIFVTDVYLDVDFAPVGQEVTTFRVQNQTQRFFFRRGRTNPPSGPLDTLMYIVEWRDQGTSSGLQSPGSITPTTWSGIKTLVLD